jgi:hypothetical protein
MPAGFSSSVAGGGGRNARTYTSIGRTPTVAPPSTPRQERQGDYIVTYSPTGSIISRVYSPQSNPRQNSTANALSAGRQQSNQAKANDFIARYQTNSAAKSAQSNSTNYGGGGALGAVGQMAQNSFDVYPATSGVGATGGSGSSGGGNLNANSGINYTGSMAGINDKQADYMVANPLAIAAKVFGIDMANNPTLAGLALSGA